MLPYLEFGRGGNRNFNSNHHNSQYAKATDALEMYANNVFLQGMWEWTVCEYIGYVGVIKSLKNFHMASFNTAGDTVVTKGKVKRKWQDTDEYFIEIEMWSENSQGISVGPGTIIATLPHNH